MIAPLTSSQFHRHFHRPVTVAALADFDPDLELVWNSKYACFQIHRTVHRAISYYVQGIGDVAWIEPVLVHVDDCTGNGGLPSLSDRDDPKPLLDELARRDTRRHPEIKDTDSVRRRLFEQRLALARKVHDNYRHAARENRRQLHRAFAPFYDYTGFVR